MNWIDGSVAVGDCFDVLRSGMLRDEGIDVVINVMHHFDGLSMTPFASVLFLASAIHVLAYEGYRILIHCTGGIDRSPFVAALYLCEKHDFDIPLMKCYDMVWEKRPQTIVHDDWARKMGLII